MNRIKLDDLTRYKFLSRVDYSPSGEHVCFSVHRMDSEENKYLSNLWVFDEEKERTFQLTSFDEENSFIWLDTEYILFSGTRNPKDKEKAKVGEEFSQFYKISINGGEAQETFRIPRKVNGIKKIDDKTFLVSSTCNPNTEDLKGLSEEEKKKALERRKEEKDFEVVDEIPFWSNGEGFTNKNRNRLYLYNTENNSLEALTETNMDIEFFDLNETKDKIILIGTTYKDKMGLQNDLYIYNLKDRKMVCITSKETFNYMYGNFMTEDTIICCGSDMENYGLNENPKFYIIDLKTKNRKAITPDFDLSLWNSVGTDCRYVGHTTFRIDGDYLYFITTEGFHSNIYRINRHGVIEQLTENQGTVDGLAVKNEHIYFIGLKDMKLQELYRLEKGKERQITSMNQWVQEERTVFSLEKLTVETAPNARIDGWILKSPTLDINKKHPGILSIHGGPKGVYGETFYHEMQYWANEGYVVFFCNPRGSDGRGDAFADIRGQYGMVDYEDIIAFTDGVLKAYPLIDKERLGVTGGSYGGFMTNWIIGHTDKFKVAVSQRSIANWISKFTTTDIGYFFVDDQQMSTPWMNHEKLWWHSPLRYADKVKTPTLFIHSEEDYRCWVTEGYQMFTALKYFGVESRLVLFKGENHELSRSGRPKQRLRRLKEMTQWFNKYLKA